jgi:hypothetical protein
MQGLAFSYEEPDLKELYLSLLASAMDGRVSADAHPGFVEIIRQLTSEEARLLRIVLSATSNLPIVEVRLQMPESQGFVALLQHLVPFASSAGVPIENPRVTAIVDNWIRLGLVTADYGIRLTGDERYAWVESRPELVRLKTQQETEENKITYERGVLTRTAFGLQFAAAVGIVDRVTT